jgi:hypothetical protein
VRKVFGTLSLTPPHCAACSFRTSPSASSRAPDPPAVPVRATGSRPASAALRRRADCVRCDPTVVNCQRNVTTATECSRSSQQRLTTTTDSCETLPKEARSTQHFRHAVSYHPKNLRVQYSNRPPVQLEGLHAFQEVCILNTSRRRRLGCHQK